MTRSRAALGLTALPGGAALTAALADGGLRLLRGGTTPGADPAGAIAPVASQDSARLWLFTQSDALLVRSPFDPARKAGEDVDYLPL